MPSRPAFGSSLNPWVGNYSMYWSQLPSHYKTRMSARPIHLSGRFRPRDWQEIQRRDIPVPGISSGPLGTGKVVTAEDASRNLEAAREAEELLRLQASQQAVSSEPINLTELAGSSPLANLSLDPFAFTPDTGVEVPTVFANEGGAVMPGLGFRPLHYQDAGAVHSVEQAENIIQTFGPSRGWGEKTIVEMILQGTPEQKIGAANEILKSPPVYGDRIGTPTADQITAETEAFEASQVAPITQAEIEYKQRGRQGVYDDAVRSETFEQFRGMQPTIGVNEAGWEALRRGETLSEETPELLGAPAYTEDMTETWQGLTNPPQGTSPFGAQYQAGGHVDRGTMAGELGRRGDLSVRQAGETMFERMKRLRGYAGGGYASRGTVAGELPRYGHMSVREEGESMGELHKRHRDQDWYNRMGGGLGSFRRRMA